MSTIEFFKLISEDAPVYLVCLAFMLISYRLFFKWKVTSIYDPLYFYIIFTNAICSANMAFLAYSKRIDNYFLTNYILSELALLLGIFIFLKKPGILASSTPRSDCRFQFKLKQGMRLAIAVIVLVNLVIYATRGIPLFMDSRSESSNGGSGFGFFTRVSQNATMLLLLFYYSKSHLTKGKTSFMEKSYVIASGVLGLLSGYKAFFLNYLFVYFLFNKNTISGKVTAKMAMVVAGGTTIMILLFSIIMGTYNINIILLGFCTRIVASGDVYYMGYVDNSLKHLPPPHFFYQMFGSTLASFRLLEWNEVPRNMGIALNEVVNKYESLDGPTFRYNMLWIYLTGSTFLTTVLSLGTGAIIGFMHRLVNQKQVINLRYIVVCFFYLKSFLLILGPDLAINDISLSIIIILPFFIIGLCILVSR